MCSPHDLIVIVHVFMFVCKCLYVLICRVCVNRAVTIVCQLYCIIVVTIHIRIITEAHESPEGGEEASNSARLNQQKL